MGIGSYVTLCFPDVLSPVRAVKNDLGHLCKTVEPLCKTLALEEMEQAAKNKQTHTSKLQLPDRKQAH